jgi:hypothetical protein
MSNGGDCGTGEFAVVTERSGATTDAEKADDVGFTIIVP